MSTIIDDTPDYTAAETFLITVDCIIFGFSEKSLKLLIFKRFKEPMKGAWALPGDIVKKDETLNEAATRILKKLTGLENIHMEQVGAFGDIDRVECQRVFSVAYYSLVNIEDYDTSILDQHEAYWFDIKDIPKLAFDHDLMKDKALEHLRKEASTNPTSLRLLPELFTLPQLQDLYEAIYGEALDKRNFRKKALDMGYFEKTNLKDKLNSKKGAFFYKFNNDVFEKRGKFKL